MRTAIHSQLTRKGPSKASLSAEAALKAASTVKGLHVLKSFPLLEADLWVFTLTMSTLPHMKRLTADALGVSEESDPGTDGATPTHIFLRNVTV